MSVIGQQIKKFRIAKAIPQEQLVQQLSLLEEAGVCSPLEPDSIAKTRDTFKKMLEK